MVGLASVIASTSATSTADTAAPASTSRTGVARRPPDPTRYTATAANSAPGTAAHTDRPAAPPSTTTVTTSEAEAPALTPSSPGSPSGLRVSPWMTTPATASAAPTSSPSSVRGMRDATTVEVYDPSGCRHADHTSPSGTAFAPTAMLRPTTSTRSTTAATSPTPSPSAREPRARVACGARARTVLTRGRLRSDVRGARGDQRQVLVERPRHAQRRGHGHRHAQLRVEHRHVGAGRERGDLRPQRLRLGRGLLVGVVEPGEQHLRVVQLVRVLQAEGRDERAGRRGQRRDRGRERHAQAGEQLDAGVAGQVHRQGAGLVAAVHVGERDAGELGVRR